MSNFSAATMLERALESYSDARPRQQQVEIGPSSIHSCARQVYHQIAGTFKTNQNINFLPALMGTAIHELIEKALEHEDIFGDDFLKEIEVEYQGLKGHIDLYIKSKKTVIDWKTTTKGRMKHKTFPFPDNSYLYQVQVYAYLLNKAMGLEVETVKIVALARDGGIQDINEYTYEYSEQLALSGIQWLNDIKATVATNGRKPEPAKDAKSFCSHFCPWWDESAKIGCPGLPRRY